MFEKTLLVVQWSNGKLW